MSKNLVVNGVDIYQQISGARAAYKIHELFDCGFHVGFAFDELFLSKQNALAVKAKNDIHAYKVLHGFIQETGVAQSANFEKLYNKIDNRGILVWGPVKKAMENIQEADFNSQKLWMSLHEIGHIFREGGELLVSEEILTQT